MIYNEKYGDLFQVGDDYILAHCISADWKLGAGIAKEIDKRFVIKKSYKYINREHEVGIAVLVNRVFNLITKPRYFDKATYKTLEGSFRYG